ncbi:hypothetical protein Z517_06419 [Fonsecaea pedrosoi CBS 271.37]|uniref:Unplaced genomic scaffold supercont1.4, whole genome shotgun sequence n=1 Tax=Fonsecaea pedrosoi CBS 271.37 TaxID=1442368 RepID=A0A0D2H541_9EURO|nr:uncharacterized protein Z517_06419 [Fonsecaea pedrosoi CBS 271.37]KIW79804.1 hypothetical protein Z517_06419 [Fonsecaea pedrosoi CBS 271.37]
MSVTTCSTTATRLNNLTGKRTNSLGWAKSDCHTCSSLGRSCDRRRPRCSACLADGVICAGYVQQLNWERGTLKVGKRRPKEHPLESGAAREAQAERSTAPLPRPSTYTFVDQSLTQTRTRRRSRNNSRSSEISIPTSTAFSQGPESVSSSASPSSTWSVLSGANTPPVVDTSHQLDLVLFPQVNCHPGGIEYALSFFHSCFANTTLTFPVKINPWRACLPSIHDEFPSVRYAAAALAKRQQAHFDRKPESATILRLKSQALSIFASHLNDLSFECGLSTVLLLIGLDYAETGIANWNIHLRGAYRILESHGGIRLAESRPNLRSQIAMLIWYDVNAALISRRGPTFPRTYIEALMAWQDDDEWSILGLNGLPDGMFLDMYGLAVAAADLDSADPYALEAIRRNILGSEVSAKQGKYQALMSEIWRLGLLLYIARVFEPFRIYNLAVADYWDEVDLFTSHESAPRGDFEPRAVAIQILTMVAEIPADSSFQKQCLMPIVLAGCEMSRAEWALRKVAIEYSERWKQKTGIWIFGSGLEFMRSVWAKNDAVVAGEFDDEDDREWVPWTEIYPSSAEYGFLFG